MLKVLIACSSEIMAAALGNSIQDYADVTLCHDGDAAHQLINDLRPDILVLSLNLCKRDGFTVLQQCAFNPPLVVALTNTINKDIVMSATHFGINKIYLLPCFASKCQNK